MMQPYRGRSQPPQVQRSLARQPRNDDFQQQHLAIFNHFDELSNRMFEGFDMPRMFRGFDDIENQLMDFSNPKVHHHMMNKPIRGGGDGAFQMVTQSYVQSSKMGPNGQMITEKYFDKNHVGKGADGKTISERQQGYKNTGNGTDKFAHERMLNDQGRKYIKERDGQGQVTTTHHYYNLDENQKEIFDQNWGGYKQQIGFGSNKQLEQGYTAHAYPTNTKRASEQNFQPQLGYGHRRATDLQPTYVGGSAIGRTPMMAIQGGPQAQTPIAAPIAAPITNQQPAQRFQPVARNEDATGVYRNRKMGSNYPQAG